MSLHPFRPAGAPRRTRGFTLIELMIVVVIVAILAAVAFPSYRKSVLKSRRSDATISLVKLAQRLERCRTQFMTYKSANCSVGRGQKHAATSSDEGYYNISMTIKQNAFTLNAQPSDKGDQSDDICQNYTLDQTGKRTARNKKGEDITDDCW